MAGLSRFIQAHKCYYSMALEEIRNGHKESNWMLYIFPQIKGLGYSSESALYGINGREEALEYLANPELRDRLIEIARAVLDCGADSIDDVLGYPDNNKLQSCMTLFNAVCPDEPVFKEVLDRFFGGEKDSRTLELLGE